MSSIDPPDISEYIRIFDLAMQPRGGRYEPTTSYDAQLGIVRFVQTGTSLTDNSPKYDLAVTGSEEYRAIAQSYIDGARASRQTQALGTMPHVHFDFVNNFGLNACAFEREGKEFIALHIGALMIIPDMFRRVLAHPDLFPHYGNAGLERTDGILLPRFPTNAHDLRAFQDQPGLRYPVFPQDPRRLNYSGLFSFFALHFLICHEIAHLRNGHVAWLNRKYGITMIPEIGWTGTSNVSPLSNQALEMNADSWAACQGISLIQGMVGNPVTVQELWPGRTDPFKAALWDWLYSVLSLFRLFSGARYVGQNLDQQPYPPARMRQEIVSATVFELLRREYDSDIADAYMQMSADVFVAVETSFANVTEQLPDMEEVLQIVKPEHNEHARKILGQWKNVVRPELLPLTRANDLPE